MEAGKTSSCNADKGSEAQLSRRPAHGARMADNGDRNHEHGRQIGGTDSIAAGREEAPENPYGGRKPVV